MERWESGEFNFRAAYTLIIIQCTSLYAFNKKIRSTTACIVLNTGNVPGIFYVDNLQYGVYNTVANLRTWFYL